MKKVVFRLLSLLPLVSLISTILRGEELKKLHQEFPLKGETGIDVQIEFGAGEFNLSKTDQEKIIVKAEYDSENFRYRVDYDPNLKTGEFFLKCRTEDNHRIDWDDKENGCDLTLPSKIPLNLEMEIGAAKSDLDLSGLKIKNFNLEVGAANTVIEFDKPNPVKMKEFKIETGASKLKITGLGNANFERMDFEGGVGNFTLDFSGELKHSAEVNISVGLGKATIKIPKELGVRIESEDSFLSHISIDENEFKEIDSDIYQTRNYGKTKGELNLYIEVGMGSVEIERSR